MIKPLSAALALHILAGTLLACSGDPMRINSVTDQAEIDKSQGRKITAKAAGFQLLLVIPIMVNSRHERAWQALLEKAGNDAITDVRITERWVYAYVGTSYTTILEATVYPKVAKKEPTTIILPERNPSSESGQPPRDPKVE